MIQKSLTLVHEIWKLRHGKFERLVDIVAWPKNESEIIKVSSHLVLKYISDPLSKVLFETRLGILPDALSYFFQIVSAANEFNVVIIPIGGGTSVSHALECPSDERRSICSVDLALMDKILWVDEANLLCRAEVFLKLKILRLAKWCVLSFFWMALLLFCFVLLQIACFLGWNHWFKTRKRIER